MEIALQITLLVIGFVLLIKGADWLVSGASSVASNFKISKQLIGLTIVAIGTGAPELAVSISSLISGNTDMLLGNVIGSNIINILLLIGVAALINPIKIKKSTISKELPLLLLISTALIVLVLDTSIAGADANIISRSDAIICVLLFAIFIYYIVNMVRKSRNSKKEIEKPKWKLGKSFLIVLIGLAGVVGGSQIVVNSASIIASAIGISDRIIALTVVALGTSLPELVTTITAAKRNENELLVGNIIGSNIFNICIVLGLPVAVFGAITPESFDILDIVMLIGSAAVLWMVAMRGSNGKSGTIKRSEGFLMLLIFLLYYSYIVYGALA
ncbi:calcium/sodium antiporter [Candidatus Saccharibacteria bacterium]|nr:calcium/sodium antiporter [Candidatus Saccharibacteria bacterium]